MNLVDLAMRRPVTISMATVAMLVFGLVLLGRLGLTLLPDLSYPTLTVRTQYTGAAPSEVENLISKPIEEAVGVIKGLRTVRSISRAGQSDVLLELNWGTDMGLAGIDVREKLDLVQLPLDVPRPQLLRFNPSLDPILRLSLSRAAAAGSTRTAEQDEQNLTQLRRLADEQLKKLLESVEGVAAVKVSGGFEDEVQVNIDQEKLAQLKLTIEQIAIHLKAENVNLSGGRLEEGTQQFLVRTINQYQSVDEMAGTIVASVEGKPVYLRDIAQVLMSYKEREAITRSEADEAVELALYKEGDANTVAVAAAIHQRLDEVRKLLGDSIKLDVVYDQSRFIEEAVSEVIDNGIQGGLLAMLVLYLFLRDFRATLIISISIPVAVVISFNLMYAFGVTLNIMSLGGMAMSIGMLIDNGIVVLENIDRHRDMGHSPWDAARLGTLEVAGPVIASTLTSVAVFLPLVFVQGVAGQLFRDQALTVTFSQFVSLLIGFTLVPMLAVIGNRAHATDTASDIGVPSRINVAVPVLSALLRISGLGAGVLRLLMQPLVRGFNRSYDALAAAYVRLLKFSLQHRWRVIAVAVTLFLLSVLLLSRIGVELIPQLSQGEFVINLRAAPGTPLAQTDRLLQKAVALIRAHGQVERVFSVAGSGNRLDASPDRGGENVGAIDVVLKKPVSQELEASLMRDLRDQLQKMPGINVQVERRDLFAFDMPLEVEIIGYDIDKLQQLSSRLVNALQAHDRFADVRSTIEDGHPEVQIVFDHERAARLGLSVPEVAQRVVRKLRGEIATRYAFHDRKIDVVVRASENERDSVARIGELLVNEDKNNAIPLSAIADIRQALGPSEIHRIGQERVAIISASVRYGDLGEAAMAAQRLLDQLPRLSGIETRVAGQNADMQASFESLQWALAFALFLVYLVMASQFESLLHPFVIMFSVPLALIGAALALTLTRQTISVVVFIGLIMLAGIVVNNAIILIDRINQQRSAGMALMAAIENAGQTRLRPIMMTMLTTVLGMLPLALGIGEGAEIRAPMAITVIGGITVSTFLTLLIIPVVYSLMERAQADTGPARAETPNPAAAETE